MSNITEVSRATQWKPGQSGNLKGRPVGTRQAFSAGFLRALAEVWSEEGRETMVKTARTNPAVFFATCARLIPNDVRVTVIALSPLANGPRGPRRRPPPHVAISQSRRHPKRHGQPVLSTGD